VFHSRQNDEWAEKFALIVPEFADRPEILTEFHQIGFNFLQSALSISSIREPAAYPCSNGLKQRALQQEFFGKNTLFDNAPGFTCSAACANERTVR